MENQTKLGKEEFIESDFGKILAKLCDDWDHAHITLNKIPWNDPDFDKTREIEHECSVQWSIYAHALFYIFGVDYYYMFTEDFYGVGTADCKDWLYKVDRHEPCAIKDWRYYGYETE